MMFMGDRHQGGYYARKKKTDGGGLNNEPCEKSKVHPKEM